MVIHIILCCIFTLVGLSGSFLSAMSEESTQYGFHLSDPEAKEYKMLASIFSSGETPSLDALGTYARRNSLETDIFATFSLLRELLEKNRGYETITPNAPGINVTLSFDKPVATTLFENPLLSKLAIAKILSSADSVILYPPPGDQSHPDHRPLPPSLP